MRRRGITQVQLAEKCGVTRQYISSIEREAESPTSEMIERIANELNFPVDFFYEPAVELIPVGAPTFRAQRKMTSAVRDMGLGGSDIAAGIIAADLQKRFTLPVIDMPDFSDFTDQPEAAADLLRARWNLRELVFTGSASTTQHWTPSRFGTNRVPLLCSIVIKKLVSVVGSMLLTNSDT